MPSSHPFPVAFADADPPALEVIGALSAGGRFSELELSSHLGVPETAEEWLERIGDARGLLLGWRIPAEALCRASNLEVVSYLGTGISDHLDIDIAAKRGIAVRTVTGYGDDAVAEHAVALLLGAWRRIPRLDRQVRAGEWPAHEARGLRGARLAVLGLGGIGGTVARLAAGLGLDVVAWTRGHAEGERERDGVPVVSLEEALTGADAVSLNVPLTAGTTHLIGADQLALLKPGAVLVNTARAGVVDTDAMLAALDSGRLSAAALDVFDEEPLAPDDPLRRREDVVLTPHTAFNTTEATTRLFEGALANLVQYVTEQEQA